MLRKEVFNLFNPSKFRTGFGKLKLPKITIYSIKNNFAKILATLILIVLLGLVFSVYQKSLQNTSFLKSSYSTIQAQSNKYYDKMTTASKNGDYFEYRSNVRALSGVVLQQQNLLNNNAKLSASINVFHQYDSFLEKFYAYLDQLEAMTNNLGIIKNADYTRLNVLSDEVILQNSVVDKLLAAKKIKINAEIYKQSDIVTVLKEKYAIDQNSFTVDSSPDLVSSNKEEEDIKNIVVDFMNKYIEGVNGAGSSTSKLLYSSDQSCSSGSNNGSDTSASDQSNNSDNKTNTGQNTCTLDTTQQAEVDKLIDSKVAGLEQNLTVGFRITFNAKYQFGLGRDFYFPSSFNIQNIKQTRNGYDVLVQTVHKYQADRTLKDQFSVATVYELIKDPGSGKWLISGQRASL